MTLKYMRYCRSEHRYQYKFKSASAYIIIRVGPKVLWCGCAVHVVIESKRRIGNKEGKASKSLEMKTSRRIYAPMMIRTDSIAYSIRPGRAQGVWALYLFSLSFLQPPTCQCAIGDAGRAKSLSLRATRPSYKSINKVFALVIFLTQLFARLGRNYGNIWLGIRANNFLFPQNRLLRGADSFVFPLALLSPCCQALIYAWER